MVENHLRTFGFGAVTGSMQWDTQRRYPFSGAFLVLKSPYNRGDYSVCSSFTKAKGYNSHYSLHDLSTPRSPMVFIGDFEFFKILRKDNNMKKSFNRVQTLKSGEIKNKFSKRDFLFKNFDSLFKRYWSWKCRSV